RNPFPLHRVVVEKRERIQPDVQLSSNLAKALRLLLPADSEGREMLRTKEHVRMTGQDFHRFMRVILAGDRQHDAAVAQIEQSALNLTIDAARIFGADLDSGRSLLSENS